VACGRRCKTSAPGLSCGRRGFALSSAVFPWAPSGKATLAAGATELDRGGAAERDLAGDRLRMTITSRTRCGFIAAALALALAAAPNAQSALASGAPAGQALRIGAMTLHQCRSGFPEHPAWCGSLPVPLDYSDPSAPMIDIGFMWFPASEPAPLPTIVAEEGGPGFPSTGSRSLYVPLFSPLLVHRSLLLVDNRGTGRSTLIRCPSLEHFAGIEPTPAFPVAVQQCGDALDHHWRRTDGSWVHASDLFNTANSARDLARVLRALETGPVDLYGDSYGTWFSQTFASRYPSLLHSVTLDASFQVLGLSPWYATSATVAHTAFNTVCALSVACSTAAPGPAWARIGALARDLRVAPIVGQTVDSGGNRVTIRVDIRALVDLVNDAGFDASPTGLDAGVYRELDAGARAWLEHRDGAPLLRLTAQSYGFDNFSFGTAAQYSDGLYFAVACTDYPQLFQMRALPAERKEQLAAAIATLPANTFAPFTTSEWLSVDAYTEAFTACVDWPAPVRDDPPIVIRPPLIPARVPVLVLGGTLDSLTPLLDGGTVVTRQMGASARLIRVVNTTHVTAEVDPYNCASRLVREFVANPRLLFGLDASCAQHIPVVRSVGLFVRHVSGEPAAQPLPGNRADMAGLQAATAAVESAGDAIYRSDYLGVPHGTGLRGGTFIIAVARGSEVLTLTGVRWVGDLAIDGVVHWAPQSGAVTAALTMVGPGGDTGRMSMTWNARVTGALATVSGIYDRHAIAAVLPAP
jgi:pimeloyl-ACP methyl ester carboxylesterase